MNFRIGAAVFSLTIYLAPATINTTTIAAMKSTGLSPDTPATSLPAPAIKIMAGKEKFIKRILSKHTNQIG